GTHTEVMMTRYTLPELPYDHTALEPHYSARLLELHHDKHHAAYVTGANATLEKLAQARDQGDFAAINQLQKSLAFHLSGHVLHSLLWRNMSPRGGGEPDGELARAIDEFFGSFAGLRGQLPEAALNVQGSGWGAGAHAAAANRRRGLPLLRRRPRALRGRRLHLDLRRAEPVLHGHPLADLEIAEHLGAAVAADLPEVLALLHRDGVVGERRDGAGHLVGLGLCGVERAREGEERER